jgi:phenylalanyl-tRNA synthetase alpha subunit
VGGPPGKELLLSSAIPADALDVTLPGTTGFRGGNHPIRQIMMRVIEVFDRIGFTVATGPDVETVFNNFDALNTPADHPSRDEQDTFYLSDGTLLRTQTSPIQIRYMLENPPPVRIIAPGRAYRRDTPVGAGMVDPKVYEAVGYDPDTTTGYAFGMGLERIAMILLEIDDIRRLYENDARFLRQFA